MKPKAELQMAELSVFVHGALTTLHILGIIYNMRRKNWFDSVMHFSAATYDCWAVNKHMKDIIALQALTVPVAIDVDKQWEAIEKGAA
jgi:hypothetical protein